MEQGGGYTQGFSVQERLLLARVPVTRMRPKNNFCSVEQRSSNSRCSSCCMKAVVLMHIITISREELNFSLPEKFCGHSFNVKAL